MFQTALKIILYKPIPEDDVGLGVGRVHADPGVQVLHAGLDHVAQAGVEAGGFGLFKLIQDFLKIESYERKTQKETKGLSDH